MSDDRKSESGMGTPNPKDKQFKRRAYSDYSMPGALFVTVCAVLLIAAIVYVGYRVIQLESDRIDLEMRELQVQEQEDLLRGRKDDINKALEVRAEISKLQNTKNLIQKNVDSLTTQVVNLETKKNSLRDVIQRSNSEVGDLRNQLITANTRLMELSDELDRLEADRATATKAIENLDAIYELRQERNIELAEEVAALTARKQTLQELIQDRELIEDIGKELKQRMAEFRDSVTDVDKQAETLSIAAIQLKTDMGDTLEALTDKLTNSAGTLSAQLSRLDSAVGLVEKSAEPLKTAEAKVAQSTLSLQRASEMAVTRLTESTENLTTVVSSFQISATNELSKFSQEVIEKQNQIGALVPQLEQEISAFGSNTNQKIVDLSKELTAEIQLIADNAQNLREAVTSTSESTSVLSDAYTDVAKLKDQLHTALDAVNAQMPKSEEALRSLVVNLQQQQTRLVDRIDLLEIGLEKLDTVTIQLEQRPATIDEARAALGVSFSELSQQLEGYAIKVRSFSSEVEAHREAAVADRALVEKLREVSTEFEKLRDAGIALRTDLNQVNETLDESLGTYKTDIAGATAELREIVEQLVSTEQALSEKSTRRPVNNDDNR